MKINLKAVRDLAYTNGRNPRIHPNGFIQLDLGEVEGDWHETHKRGHSGSNVRLHIWNPPGIELPHQGTTNEIHDHVFDMRSTVLRGTLEQRLYEFEEWQDWQGELPPTHEMYQAVYAKSGDSRLEPTGKQGRLEESKVFKVSEGQQYFQPAFTLHDTGTPDGCVVTYMEKTHIWEGDATVVCPIGTEPDNSFDRASAMDESNIWHAIDVATRAEVAA